LLAGDGVLHRVVAHSSWLQRHEFLISAAVLIGVASYRDTVRFVLRLESGKIKELWLDPVNTAAFDAFF
jgi:hypothetical protein